MQSVHDAITDAVFDVLGVHNSVASRTSYGGTAPGAGARPDRPLEGAPGMIRSLWLGPCAAGGAGASDPAAADIGASRDPPVPLAERRAGSDVTAFGRF
jgi:hypothetical protein